MWKKRNDYYLECDGWTIAKMKYANTHKYALWQGNVSMGFYETADEAKAKYTELTK